MVEKTHTAGPNLAGWYPSILGPLHGIQQHIAEFYTPQADAASTEAHYEINLELPGVALDDIRIDIHGHELIVHGEKKIEREETGKTYFFSERAYGAFQRSFRLPPKVDPDGITARFRDGVLRIRVPRPGTTPEGARRVTIARHAE